MGRKTPLQQLADEVVRVFRGHEAVPERWREGCVRLASQMIRAVPGMHLTTTQMQAWLILLLVHDDGSFLRCLKGLSARERYRFLMEAMAEGLCRWPAPYPESMWINAEAGDNLEGKNSAWVAGLLLTPLIMNYLRESSVAFRNVSRERDATAYRLS